MRVPTFAPAGGFPSHALGLHFGDGQTSDYSDRQSSPVRPPGHAARHADPKSHIEELGPPMAVPKRRMSRSNTRSRRSQWKAEKTELVGVTVAGQRHKVPRRLLKAARLGLIDLDRR
jgi:large subunit ribosomal protein L32